MKIYWFFIWTNLHPLQQRMLSDKIVWHWLSGSGGEDFLNFVNVFSLFPNYLPLEKVRALHSPKDVLCQVWLKLAQWFWRRRLLNFFPWKRAVPFIWIILWQDCMKLAQWFWRKFLNFLNVFSLFRIYLPLEKGRAIHLNKFESPSPKKALCQVWLKLAQWFWRRRF